MAEPIENDPKCPTCGGEKHPVDKPVEACKLLVQYHRWNRSLHTRMRIDLSFKRNVTAYLIIEGVPTVCQKCGIYTTWIGLPLIEETGGPR